MHQDLGRRTGDLVKRRCHSQRDQHVHKCMACLETSKGFKVFGLRDSQAGQVDLIHAREFGLCPVGIWSKDDGFWNRIVGFHPHPILWVVRSGLRGASKWE